jgi:hypothetical protein
LFALSADDHESSRDEAGCFFRLLWRGSALKRKPAAGRLFRAGKTQKVFNFGGSSNGLMGEKGFDKKT